MLYEGALNEPKASQEVSAIHATKTRLSRLSHLYWAEDEVDYSMTSVATKEY